jgi:hypothetical protein
VALAGGEDGRDRLAAALGRQVQLAPEATPAAAEAVVVIWVPFFRAPAACWWARMLLLSIIVIDPSIRSSWAASLCISVKIRSQMPAACQRRKRL